MSDSLASAIIEAARQVARHGTRSNVFYMSPRDYADLQDTFEYSDIEDVIRRVGGTYQERTTRLGQLAVARRLAGRRGQRFHAKQWWAA